MEHPAVLLRGLNPYCARAMEGTASLCQTCGHAEILSEYGLLKLLEQGGWGITVSARRYEWGMDAIWQDLLAFLDKLLRPVCARPKLPDGLQSLLHKVWLYASRTKHRSLYDKRLNGFGNKDER